MLGQVEKPRNIVGINVLRIVGRLGLALVITLSGYLLIYRPLQLNWGTTQEEIDQPMLGDEIQLYPMFNATRAVTVNGPPTS
jgi:hypothetical protein